MTPEQRHANMAAIHSKNTKPELIVRKYLWAHGYRYRLNCPRLPGKPDVVLHRYRTCIFVNGCFWHGHLTPDDGPLTNSPCCKIPKTNTEFWESKIRRNKERDISVQQQLARMGWHSITIWECQLRSAQRTDTLRSLVYTLNRIFLQDQSPKPYALTQDAPVTQVAEPEATE